eukprot:TRINITY_DN2374_c0_g6_i1.p1 TRINITY_DN2374_c0_g6~~TRINITY_DN2374_c0_g6_i1.p1  ORF type:complete len:414 (+),score=106.15 TRINITY_DN2374_c0_g6_i1:55-1296(+)
MKALGKDRPNQRPPNQEKSKERCKKISIETKISVSQQPPGLQSVKNSLNPVLENLLSHRFAEYKRQSSNLRNSTGTKKSNWNSINKNPATKPEGVKRVLRGTRPGTTKGRQNKKLFKSSIAKGLCMLNNTISMAQPISVNINISNHLVAPEKRSYSKNKTPISNKRNAIKKQKTLNVLEVTQPVKGISEIIGAGVLAKQITPKAYLKKGFDLRQRQESRKALKQKRSVELRKSFEQRKSYDPSKSSERMLNAKKSMEPGKRNELKVETELRKSFETAKESISNLKANSEQYSVLKKILKQSTEISTKSNLEQINNTAKECADKFKFEESKNTDKKPEHVKAKSKQQLNSSGVDLKALFQKPCIQVEQNHVNPSITFKAQTQRFSLWFNKKPEMKQSFNAVSYTHLTLPTICSV